MTSTSIEMTNNPQTGGGQGRAHVTHFCKHNSGHHKIAPPLADRA